MLRPYQALFVTEHVSDGCANAAAAIVRAGYKGEYPAQAAWEMLQTPRVREAVDAGMRERVHRNHLTVDFVLAEWRKIISADPNELMRTEVRCCRYCHGIDHRYQWRDDVEFAEATENSLREHQAACDLAVLKKRPMPELRLPSYAGGIGFRMRAQPHATCPRCEGLGHTVTIVADSDSVSPEARKLFAGVKRTKDGIEIKTRDQDAALLNLAKYLGMQVNLNDIPKNSTLADLLGQVKGSTLPIGGGNGDT